MALDGKGVRTWQEIASDASREKDPKKLKALAQELEQAFVERDALMCGFCTLGFVTTVSAYLKSNPHPTLAQVREACKGNFCRCGTYPRVFEAALAAAKSG